MPSGTRCDAGRSPARGTSCVWVAGRPEPAFDPAGPPDPLRWSLERLLARASRRTIVALVATPSGRPLYEEYGFRTEDSGSVGMLLRPS